MAEPDNLIHKKLNRILAWMEVRGKQLDVLSDDIKSIKGAVWANDRNVRAVQTSNIDLDTRLTALELDAEEDR